MSSYKIIYNISNILSRISWHGLPSWTNSVPVWIWRTS